MPPSSSQQQEWYKRTGSFSGGGGGGASSSASSALMSVGSASLRLVAGTLSTGYNTISTAAAAASSAVGSAATGTDSASFSSDTKEKVLWARFDTLDVEDCSGGGTLGLPRVREVLLLGYAVGFQVWDVTDPGEVQELLSLRDVTVRCVQPLPAPLEPDSSSSPMKGQRPVLAVVPQGGGGGASGGGGGDPSGGPRGPSSPPPPSGGTIELHSAASQALVRILPFHSRVVSVRASPRILAVALETQLLGFDASSLDKLFTAMTYPTPGSGPAPHEGHLWAAPLALGHRWLAYASNQPVKNPSGYATPQATAPVSSSSSAPGGSNHHHLSYSIHDSYGTHHNRHGSGGSSGGGGGGGGGSGGSSYRGYVKNVASQAAAVSGKQLKAGISWVGDTSYKLLSSQYASWTAGSSSSFKRPSSDGGDLMDAPGGMMGRSPDSFGGYFGGMSAGGGGSGGVDPLQAQVAGTVTVCDVMRRHTAVAHFRAHTSPLALLAWDPSGLLLVTASVYGHSVNVFQICPPAAPAGGGGGGGPGAALHLYKLSRGITPALITDAVFSCSGEWLAVSSGRGTTHLFHLGSEQQQQQQGGAAAGHNNHQRPLMVSSCSSAAGAPPQLQHLSPVGRLRSSRGWAARVPGAPLAAAAAGLYAGGPGTAGPSVGAIAARFTCSSSSSSAASSSSGRTKSGGAGGGHSYQGEVLLAHEQQQQQHPQGSMSSGGPPSSEELLIAGPEGTLTRYLVGLSCSDGAPGGSSYQGPEADDEGMMFGSSPASMSSAFSMEGNDPDASELASEVVSRLDVCRRLAWPERGNLTSEALSAVSSPHGKVSSASAAAAAAALGGAMSEFPRVADTEEERHSFVANAEICRHPVKAPLWAAAPQFHFLELQQQQQSPVAGAVPSSGCVEEIPTRRVDVARGELLPSGTYWDPFMAPSAAAAIA